MEKVVGHPVPPLLKRIYLEVANGGPRRIEFSNGTGCSSGVRRAVSAG